MEATMNIRKYSIALLALALASMSGIAMAEDMASGCEKPGAPQQIQGQVVNVNTAQEKITVRDASGMIHEFQASKETLQEYKAGDPIKAKLRCDK
jgi:hypothetical protein